VPERISLDSDPFHLMSSWEFGHVEQDADRIACISVEEGKDVRGQKACSCGLAATQKPGLGSKRPLLRRVLGWYKVKGKRKETRRNEGDRTGGKHHSGRSLAAVI
jgi:hypothetical protein